jgi:hypothetical protein
MKTKVDFSKYQFRASQCHKLMTGTIGLSNNQRAERDGYLQRKIEHAEGNAKPLTAIMEQKLIDLNIIDKEKTLPKTMISELRTIHRAETYNRNFTFTNKYVQKGIQQEDEAITNYFIYRNEKGLRTMFRKNELRLKNEWFSGEPDLGEEGIEITKWKEGWDTKCSWDLSTFPFPDDELDSNYISQNQVYMNLTGAEKWTTVYVLVNGTEHQINNEKMKWFYSFNQPETDSEDYQKYLQKCKEVERMMIFDYDRFMKIFPYHDMVHTKEDWFETVNPSTGLKGFDIPLEERVIEKTVQYSPEYIIELKERITIARQYLNSL